MTIEELIRELMNLEAEHGNLTVVTQNEGHGRYTPVDEVHQSNKYFGDNGTFSTKKCIVLR